MNKKRLFLSMYVGAISLSVATLSMSIAWYASSTRLRIENIVISIDCDRQLAISTNPDSGYKSALGNADLQDCGEFHPVTSGHLEWLDQKSNTPLFYNDCISVITDNEEHSLLMNYGYFSQKLYLKADDDVIVTINPSESYIKPKEDANKAYAEQLYNLYKEHTKAEYEEQLNELVKAMRYSILLTDNDQYKFIIIDPNKNDETYYAGILDVDDDDYYDCYQNPIDGLYYEKVYGVVNDESLIVYDEPLENDSGYKDVYEEPNAFNARHKKDVYRFNLEKSLQNGLVIQKEVSHTFDEFDGEDNPFKFPVYVNRPTEIVLSIYIEGWDLDSVNYTKGATFDSNLSFVIEQEM